MTIDAWRAVLPVQAADEGDLLIALDAVKAHRLAFWDAMLWACARRAGVRHLLTEDLQDGFALQGVTFVNPFKRNNDRLIDDLPPATSFGTAPNFWPLQDAGEWINRHQDLLIIGPTESDLYRPPHYIIRMPSGARRRPPRTPCIRGAPDIGTCDRSSV